MPRLDTNSVTQTPYQYGALSAVVFDVKFTVSDGTNGWAVLDNVSIDGELYFAEIEHDDAAVAGTFDVELLSEFTEQQLLEPKAGQSVSGLAVNASYRIVLVQAFTSGEIRPLLVAGKQQFRVKFSTPVVTRVRVVIWYKPARIIRQPLAS